MMKVISIGLKICLFNRIIVVGLCQGLGTVLDPDIGAKYGFHSMGQNLDLNKKSGWLYP